MDKTYIPYLVMAVALTFIIRRNLAARRIRANTLWVFPILLVLIAGLSIAQSPPRDAFGIAVVVAAAFAGAVAGWYRGKLTHITLDAETGVLTDVFNMRWGYEIYSLLTRWNPLNRARPFARDYIGKNVLVVGLGPAGSTLAQHLVNAGFGVVGIDDLKIEPLPPDFSGVTAAGERVPFAPVHDIASIYERLDELGIDYCIVYPTAGLGIPRIADDAPRRAVIRGFNIVTHDYFKDLSDKLTPAAVLPMHTPHAAMPPRRRQ